MRAGIDLGGTKTEILVLDDDGLELFRHRVVTPKDSYQAIIASISKLFNMAEQHCGRLEQLGVGTPGSQSRQSGLMRNSNTLVLNGKPLTHDLQQVLNRPVRLANDANCFALSEAVDGAAAGAEVVFGVIIGTGTGGGVVVRQKLIEGSNGIGGEWGHNPLPWPQAGEGYDGPSCYCGQHSCIETFLSGTGLAADHLRVTGEQRDAVSIAQQADAAEPHCLATMERYCERMARALAGIINVLDPDVIVLGGGVSNIQRLYQQVPQLWDQYVFAEHVTTRLVQARHGDSSGVRGAAWLWPLPQQAD